MADTPDIFLSHSSKDDEFVDRIYKSLMDAGILAWCDHHSIPNGVTFDRAIQDALNTCEIGGIVVLSPHSVASDEVLGEWRHILTLDKRLYVAYIADVSKEDFPSRLRPIQWSDLRTDFEEGMQSLILAITENRPLSDKDPSTISTINLSGQFPRIQLDLPLIGRDTEKQAILDSIASENRVTAILGFGGVGKTRLAAEIAVTATDFRDGVIWHHIDKLATPQKLIQQVREHLNLPPMEDDPTWAELGKRQLLIILDNAEDCVSPEAYIQRLNTLDTDSGTRVLMTSRVLWRKLKAERVDLAAPDHESAVEILQAMIEGAGHGGKLSAYTVGLLYLTQGNIFNTQSKSDNTIMYMKFAIEAYQTALNYFTPELTPCDTALTQYYLGVTSAELSLYDCFSDWDFSIEELPQTEHLQRSINALEASLNFWQPDISASHFVAIRFKLGRAYLDISQIPYTSQERQDFLKRAIESFNEALAFWTTDSTEVDLSTTQNHLGSAYSELAKYKDQKINLNHAIEAYKASMSDFATHSDPIRLATTLLSLGRIYKQLGDSKKAEDYLRRAEPYLKSAQHHGGHEEFARSLLKLHYKDND